MKALTSKSPVPTGTFPKLVLMMIVVAAAIQIIHGFTLPIVGDDAAYHLNWLDQFSQLRSQGVDYPRWLTQSYGGFGSPTFYFYPPLPYFVASLLSGFTMNPVSLYQAIGILATITSCWTCFIYLRTINIERTASIAAALFYAIAPYRFVDMYARNALGEHFSFVFLPLLLASIELIRRSKGFDRNAITAIVLGALGWGGAILVNIPATVIFAMTFIVYALIRLWGQLPRVYLALIGGLLGALIAAIYLIPVFELRDQTQMNHIFDIGSQEQKWSYIMLEFFQNDLTQARILNALMLGVSIICLIGSIMAWRKRRATNEAAGYLPTLVAMFSLGVFFQMPGISALIYEITPINLIKYSWRWNVVLTLALALFVTRLGELKVRWPAYVLLAIVLLSTIVLSVRFGKEFGVHRPYEILKDFYLDAPEYVPKFAQKEYSEVTRFAHMNKLAPDVLFNAQLGVVSLISREPERISYVANVREKMMTVFHQFYWPQWKLWRGSEQIELGIDKYGRAVAELPPGNYNLELRLEPSAGQRTGAWLSTIGAVLLALFIAYATLMRKKEKVTQPST